MNALSKYSTPSLKDDFCAGNKNVIWKILEAYFSQASLNLIFYNNTLTNTQFTQLTGEVFQLMAFHVQENPTEFCEEKESSKNYLEKLFKAKLKQVRKENRTFGISFEEEYMGNDHTSPSFGEEEEESFSPQNFSSETHFFVRSLTPLEEVIFNVKFVKSWEGKNNILHLVAFLLNTHRLTNQSLETQLAHHQELSLPLIQDWFEQVLEKSFLANSKHQPQPWEFFCDSIQNIVDKDALEKLRIHSQNLNRKKLQLSKQLLLMEKYSWSTIEKYIFILHQYLEVENLVEFWFQLCKASENNLELKKQLMEIKLFRKDISFKNLPFHTRAEKVKRNKNIGKKETEKIKNTFHVFENKIDKKIKQYISDSKAKKIARKDWAFKTINWKTY